ncbi:MAG TPA: hypothetical protein VFG72_11685 [Marmoricola sp.]|nr:hypothetical protein [Marmoricola sp.]
MSATMPRHTGARRASTRSVVAAALVAVAIGGGGAASAYWAGLGTGTASGATATTTAVTLTPGTATASLHPGGTGDVSAEARNPGSAEVVVPSLELDTTQGSLGLAVDADHPDCPTTAFTFATQDNGGAGWTVPGRSGGQDGELVLTLPHALRLAADAPNGCQGATVTVYLRSV